MRIIFNNITGKIRSQFPSDPKYDINIILSNWENSDYIEIENSPIVTQNDLLNWKVDLETRTLVQVEIP
jgi:hypothetical protein